MAIMDQAIVFKSSLNKINEKIDNFKSCNLDMTEFEKARDAIISSLEAENVKTYEYSQRGVGLKQQDFLIQNYQKAFKNLESLYIDLSKYDIYYQAASIFKLIKIFLSNKEKQEEEFTKIRSILIITLKNLLYSDSLDYKVEGPVIEDIYDMTYLFIKEEIAYFGHSETLESIINLEYCCNYLSPRIKKELMTFDLDNPKYLEVAKIKNEMDSKGDFNYTNPSLIKAIVNASITLEKRLKTVKELAKKIDKYNKTLTDLEKEVSNFNIKISDVNYNLKDHKKPLFKKMGVVSINIGLAVTLLISANWISKRLTKNDQYGQTTTIYNSETEEEYVLPKEYVSDKEDKVTLYNYTPYREYIDDDNYHQESYVRSVKTYDLTSVGDMTFEEYLALDLKTLGIKPKENNEYKNTLDVSDLYIEAYNIIEKITTNQNDKVTTYEERGGIFVALLFLAALIYFFSYYVIEDSENRRGIECFKGIIEDLRDIRDERITKKTYEKKLKELTNQLNDFCNQNIEVINELENLIPYLEQDNYDKNKIKNLNGSIELARKLIKENRS